MSERDDDTQLLVTSRNMEERGTLKHILCARCTRGTVTRRAGQMQPVAFCEVMRREVPPDLVECTSFNDQKTMSMYTMRELAHDIDPRQGVNDGSYA